MRRLASLAAVIAVVVSACSTTADPSPNTPSPTGSDAFRGDISRIEIGLSEGLAPSLEFEPGLTYTDVQSTVVWEGEGDPLVDGEPLLLDIYAESLVDGTTVQNSFDGLPHPFLLVPEFLGEGLYGALSEQQVGARVLHVAPPLDETSEEPPIALVVDILPFRAAGTSVGPTDGLPIVVLEDNGEPQITVSEDLETSSDLQVATLIQGSGPQIRENSLILAQYKAVRWEDGSVLNSSWDAGKAPLEGQIGSGALPLGLEQGLIDQTAGSQVLLVVPSSLGYPEEGTLVFVVDILDVWNPEE